MPAGIRQPAAQLHRRVEEKYIEGHIASCDTTTSIGSRDRTCYRLRQQHHKHLYSADLLERSNRELQRRSRAIQIFSNGASCPRLVRPLALETRDR